MYKIFVIEDDPKLCSLVKGYLEMYKFKVFTVEDFEKVEEQFQRIEPHLVLLDINLPCTDGFYLCRTFRKKSSIPIIIVSARDGDMEQIMGINLGADDYITKPFNFELLVVKIRAALRRSCGEYCSNEKNLKVNGLEIEEDTFKLKYNNNEVELTKNEFKLIKKLMENKDKIVTREELLEALWDDTCFVNDNSLTVNVTRIKNKLLTLGISNAIKTKRGAGYLLNSSEFKEDNNE